MGPSAKITHEEVLTSKLKLKSNETPCNLSGDLSIDCLWDFFNDIYSSGYIPDELARSVYPLLHMKAKLRECSDFSAFSLMSHETKFLLKVILCRIKGKISSEVGAEQFAFKAKSDTGETMLYTNSAPQNYISGNCK